MLDAGKERIDPNFSIRFVSIRTLQLDSSSDISSPTWESQFSPSALIVVVFLGLFNHRSSSLNMKKQWTASELGFQQHLHPHLQCSLMDQWFDLWEKQWIICRKLYIYTYYLQVNFQMNCKKIDMIRHFMQICSNFNRHFSWVFKVFAVNIQGLVNVPFWEYWTSPKIVAIIDHIPFMVGWCSMGTFNDPWHSIQSFFLHGRTCCGEHGTPDSSDPSDKELCATGLAMGNSICRDLYRTPYMYIYIWICLKIVYP